MGLFLGWLAALKEDRYSDNRAIDIASGLILGVLASITSLILGTIMSYLARNAKNPYSTLMGYFVPPILMVVYMVLAILFS